MRVYIVFAHPRADSFCRATLDAFTRGLREANHEFEVTDLYAMNFNPLLEPSFAAENSDASNSALPADVLAEHERIRHADAMAFVFPLWWSDVPAILKGWFDRVWANGFARSRTGDRELRRLALRNALVLCVAGNSRQKLEEGGVTDALRSVLIGDRLTNVGFRHAELVILGGLTTADEATRLSLLTEAHHHGWSF